MSTIQNEHIPTSDIPNPGTGVELWVNEGEVALAQGVIDRANLSALSDQVVVCPHCDAENPASFARCWSCQGPIDAPATP